jgi:hypothetical protein
MTSPIGQRGDIDIESPSCLTHLSFNLSEVTGKAIETKICQ